MVLRPDTPLDDAVKERIVEQLDSAARRLASVESTI
jgi:hypothetical protein